MISLHNLEGIPASKRSAIIQCLDSLLMSREKDDRLAPLISGYNWYSTVIPEADRAIILSHLHETQAYQEAMIKDLETLRYHKDDIVKRIRNKGARHLWDPRFIHRDEKGELLHLTLEDKRSGVCINLQPYQSPLSFYPEFVQSKGYLIADEQGWEINMPFHSKQELKTLTSLVLEKSTREHEKPWPDAYKIPVLLLGKSALDCAKELPDFECASKISMYGGNNEISFVIHKSLIILKASEHYKELMDLGFSEEPCLANKSFVWSIDSFI